MKEEDLPRGVAPIDITDLSRGLGADLVETFDGKPAL